MVVKGESCKAAAVLLPMCLLTIWAMVLLPGPVGRGQVQAPVRTEKPAARAHAATALSPQELFRRLSNSVFVVEALESPDQVRALGSAVAVGPDEVITNEHVVARGRSLRVRYGEETWSALPVQLDRGHDLCLLKVSGLAASPVALPRPRPLR